MHVQTGCSGNDSDIVIPSLFCSDSQPADSPCFLNGRTLFQQVRSDSCRHLLLVPSVPSGTFSIAEIDGHRVWFQQFGTRLFRSQDRNGNVTVNYRFCPAVSVPLSIALPIWVS